MYAVLLSKRLRTMLLVAGLSSLAASPVQATPAPAKGITVMTRYMKVFSDLETRLLTAQQQGDSKTLKSLLSPFFQANNMAHGSTQYLPDMLKKSADTPAWRLSRLKVYEVGDTAVAYLTLSAKDQPDRHLADVWAMHQHHWQLRVRFESP
ncbi:nuclear transport factor 2 family protein [Gallaecimonas sp. GXIMD1310]|uniref:nuclear transport factor 2 family protein n=1 Tax=Gallaecimonas sp. GXIMD1310 TaxID=3131926 RepID=UPI003254462F